MEKEPTEFDYRVTEIMVLFGAMVERINYDFGDERGLPELEKIRKLLSDHAEGIAWRTRKT